MDIIGAMTNTVDVALIIPFAHTLIHALPNAKRNLYQRSI